MDQVNTFIDWAMVLVIWLVQLVVYPGFRRIEESRFIAWHSRYLKLMGYIVGPLMIGQLGFAIWNAFTVRQWISAEAHYLGLVALTWIVTFRIVVPIHDNLQDRGKELELIKQLVLANWPRTVLWSIIVFVQWSVFTECGTSQRSQGQRHAAYQNRTTQLSTERRPYITVIQNQKQ